MKLWDKGYDLNTEIEKFTVGEDYVLDQRLISYDCTASIAHAQMLHKIGILNDSELEDITALLNEIKEKAAKGEFIIARDQEDCHSAIEQYLVQRLGDAGKKIHTARSRNDQVLTALRLYYKDEMENVKSAAAAFTNATDEFIGKYGRIKFPGYTHMRKAMPSTIKMWAGAYRDAMKDNGKLIDSTLFLIDQSPLGTGAGYGVPIDVDRELTAGVLEFDRIQENPVYAQHSRGKFEATILHVLAQVMYDLNRCAVDLITFSMPEFGYFKLPDEFCTGSSIMPQKKNPDVLELVRGKYHQLVSLELQVRNTAAGLLSGYNRDLQLTKGPVMTGFDVTIQTTKIMALVFQNLQVIEENCNKALTDELYATHKVYEMVKKGRPFREAYKEIAKQIHEEQGND